MENELKKRVFDLAVAIPAFLISAPVMLLISAFLRMLDGKGGWFCQTRPGLFGKPFRMYKFRTMSNIRDASGSLLPDEDRITRLGRILRASSLDELPELFNVLKGEMSLVGPRPLLMEYMDRYTAEEARRHEVKPGITGWAQVNGRNSIGWNEKFRLDIWYVDHQSLWLDLRILLLTVLKVFSREGISQSSHATMEEFRGTAGEGASGVCQGGTRA
jgi:lipopolysaccharide/colanic/teichoic acid biosynthesis glycosyltransferase